MKFRIFTFKPTVDSIISTFTDTVKRLEEVDNACCEKSVQLGDEISRLRADRDVVDREGARARAYATKLRTFFEV